MKSSARIHIERKTMSVSLHLTTRQVPVFKKIMKDAKAEVEVVNQAVELDADNYPFVADAIAVAWFKMAMENHEDESLLMGIVQNLSPIAKYFPDDKPEPELPDSPPVTEAPKTSKEK
jgi:hypothetical protein